MADGNVCPTKTKKPARRRRYENSNMESTRDSRELEPVMISVIIVLILGGGSRPERGSGHG
jgi:hypothetical protein